MRDDSSDTSPEETAIGYLTAIAGFDTPTAATNYVTSTLGEYENPDDALRYLCHMISGLQGVARELVDIRSVELGGPRDEDTIRAFISHEEAESPDSAAQIAIRHAIALTKTVQVLMDMRAAETDADHLDTLRTLSHRIAGCGE